MKFNLKRARVIYRKELLETLRDRRTLFVMILLPILLYPLIFMGLSFIMQAHMSRLSQDAVQVTIWAPSADTLALAGALRGDSDMNIKVHPLPRPEDDALCAAASAAVSNKDTRLIVLKDGPDCRKGPSLERDRVGVGPLGRVEVLYDGTDDLSRRGAEAARELLEAHRRALLEDQLAAAGVDKGYAEPFSLSRLNVASQARMGGYFAGQVIPLILVLMVILGAFYPAIDLTAGEKERGTLESLLCTPTAPIEAMLGKYAAVIVISLIAATMNLVSMSLTIHQMTASIDVIGLFSLGWGDALIILALLLPTALLFSALMLALATFARDFKEAQNYLTPAFMLAIVPAALSGLPGMKLGVLLGLVPGLNITLVIKEILMGEAAAWSILWVIGVNLLYAVLVLRFAARLFADERVLFGASKPWDLIDTFRNLRIPPEPGATLTPTSAFVLFLVLLALLFHVGASVQSWDLFWGMLVTQWGLLLAPVLLIGYLARVDLKAALHLRRPTGRAILGAILVGLSAWTVALGLSALIEHYSPDARAFGREMAKVMGDGLADHSFIGILLLFAVSPAICEEAFFRGIMLSSTRGFGRWGAILLNAALFGAFHMHLYRFAPTALLGLVIAFAVWESRSILLGVIIHGLSNSLVFTLQAQPRLAELLGVHEGQEGFPYPLLALAALLPVGIWLLRRPLGARAEGR